MQPNTALTGRNLAFVLAALLLAVITHGWWIALVLAAVLGLAAWMIPAALRKIRRFSIFLLSPRLRLKPWNWTRTAGVRASRPASVPYTLALGLWQ